MNKLLHSVILSVALAVGSVVHAQLAEVQPDNPPSAGPSTVPLTLIDRDGLGLPGLRPRLTMAMPLRGSDPFAEEEDAGGMFSWSLEAWQLNTASLAHIQCNRLTPTIDSYLAEDCRFVDQPVPENAVNLVQLRGEWAAAPGLNIGLGAFSSQPGPGAAPVASSPMLDAGSAFGALALQGQPTQGVDMNVSFGIAHDRIGEFLIGLQVARYRQRNSLLDLGLGGLDPYGLPGGEFQRYANSAQLAFGWRRGSFSGDLLGHSREVPLYLGSGQYGHAPLNSFDLEFSWRAVRNASISIGVSNVLDAAPRGAEDVALEPGVDDPLEHVFGRIPYVRYKHDL